MSTVCDGSKFPSLLPSSSHLILSREWERARAREGEPESEWERGVSRRGQQQEGCFLEQKQRREEVAAIVGSWMLNERARTGNKRYT